MPGIYLLTIFNYFIVVLTFGELPFICFENLKLKHQPVTFWVKFTGNIWLPHRESNQGRLGENQKSFEEVDFEMNTVETGSTLSDEHPLYAKFQFHHHNTEVRRFDPASYF